MYARDSFLENLQFDDPQAAQPEHHEDENLVCHGNEQV